MAAFIDRDLEIDCAVTRTNARGQTKTLDREINKTAGSRTVTTTGTGYNGNPINNEATWTTLT